jgi:hypothetical protein
MSTLSKTTIAALTLFMLAGQATAATKDDDAIRR